jgi:hypothetical protein
MPLSKKHLTYGGVLVIAAGAFLWDHVTSAPAPAEAASAAAPAPATQKSSDAAVSPAAPSRPTAGRENVGLRLKSIASARQVDVDQTPDAFAVPADWLPKSAPAAGKPSNNEEDVEAGRAFADKHSLNAVMMQSKRGYAIVDGQGVFVGSLLGKYKLIAVTKETACFARDAVRIELRLGEKPRVWRDLADSPDREGDNNGTARNE